MSRKFIVVFISEDPNTQCQNYSQLIIEAEHKATALSVLNDKGYLIDRVLGIFELEESHTKIPSPSGRTVHCAYFNELALEALSNMMHRMNTIDKLASAIDALAEVIGKAYFEGRRS